MSILFPSFSLFFFSPQKWRKKMKEQLAEMIREKGLRHVVKLLGEICDDKGYELYSEKVCTHSASLLGAEWYFLAEKFKEIEGQIDVS